MVYITTAKKKANYTKLFKERKKSNVFVSDVTIGTMKVLSFRDISASSLNNGLNVIVTMNCRVSINCTASSMSVEQICFHSHLGALKEGRM